jgi:glycosyltransferase involved in cell wall biosynthesis
MKTRKRHSLHLGIFADYGTTLQPDEGIGVFVHHLIAALRRIEPTLRITLWVHPGEEHRTQRQLRKYGRAVQVFPPARWKWLGWWLDMIDDLRSLLRDRVMSRMSGIVQRNFIVLWKQSGDVTTSSWRSRALRTGLLAALVLAAPFVWLTAVCYHLLVHGLLGAVRFPAAVLLRGWSQDHLPPQPDCDIWLVPLGRTPVAFQAPEIVLLWDLAHHHVSGIFGPDMAETTDVLFASRVNRAAAVVCAAESVRRVDLLRLYPDAANRMRVIPLAVPEDMKPPTQDEKDRVRQRFSLRRPFLFYPAALRTHKNHRTLIEALHQLRSRYGLDLDLVCTGKGDVPPEIAEAITRLDLDGKVRFLGLVERKDIPALYSLAAATVFPSLHEGFGLPVLEALACGGLLTCSDLPSFRELLNGFEEAVVWFDPRHADAIAAAVARTLQERERLEHAQQQALGRLTQRTWDDVAGDYLDLFEKVAWTPMPAAGSVRGTEILAHV